MDLWLILSHRTVGPGPVARREVLPFTDVDAGQAALMGTIREAEAPTVFVLRLKVVDTWVDAMSSRPQR